jgi:hypothetical protein
VVTAGVVLALWSRGQMTTGEGAAGLALVLRLVGERVGPGDGLHALLDRADMLEQAAHGLHHPARHLNSILIVVTAGVVLALWSRGQMTTGEGAAGLALTAVMSRNECR